MFDTSIPAFPDNIKNLAGHSPNRRRAVSLFAGWSFIRFREGNEESFPVSPVYDYDCPTIEYNPNCASLEHLENPTFAPFWLPLALSKICAKILAEAISEATSPGEYDHDCVGEGWDNFRAEICKHCDLTMEELMRHARVNGFESGVDYMTQCIFFESGLAEAIEARQTGRAVLRTA